MDEGSPQMPTPEQILKDLQIAAPNDIVFTDPPCDSEIKGPDVQKAIKVVNASQYLKEKQESELPQVISDVNKYIDELKTALNTTLSPDR